MKQLFLDKQKPGMYVQQTCTKENTKGSSSGCKKGKLQNNLNPGIKSENSSKNIYVGNYNEWYNS